MAEFKQLKVVQYFQNAVTEASLKVECLGSSWDSNFLFIIPPCVWVTVNTLLNHEHHCLGHTSSIVF